MVLIKARVDIPRPAGTVPNAVHLRDACGQKATERPSESRSREKYSTSDAELRASVPATEIIVHAWKKSRLGNALSNVIINPHLGRSELTPDLPGRIERLPDRQSSL